MLLAHTYFIVALLSVGLALTPIAEGACSKVHRSSAKVRKFKDVTGWPKGRPGYVVDHIIPLCAGGVDELHNMQWQTVEEAKVKDVDEKLMCKQMCK